MPALEALFRWIHIVAGIVWIGHLYFFNFVNGPFAGTMDPDTRKKVVPQLMPRALYWFRWGAAWTWVTGVLLVLLIFYHGREVFPGIRGFALPDIVMILVTFLAFLGYDALWKSGLGKDIRVGAALCYGLVVVIVLLYVYWARCSAPSWRRTSGCVSGRCSGGSSPRSRKAPLQIRRGRRSPAHAPATTSTCRCRSSGP